MRLWLVAALGCLLPAASVAAPRPIEPEDLFRLSLVSSAQISPDGGEVAYVVRRADGPSNGYLTDIWLAAVGGGAPRPMTRDGASSEPAWSPDGSKLAFVRKVTGKPQVFSYSVAEGGVRQLTRQPGGASGPLWSHDGRRIAFAVASVDPAPSARIDFAAAGFQPTEAQRTSDIRTIEVERYEVNGAGFTYDKHQRLWTMAPDGSGQTALVKDDRWSEDQYVWSPDDRTLAFVSLHRDAPQANESDIYTVPSTGGAALLMRSRWSSNAKPAFTRDGRLLHLSGDVLDGAEYPALVATDPDGARAAVIVPTNTATWGDLVLADLRMPSTPCGPLVLPDGRRVITNVSGPGEARLVAVDLTTGTMTPVGRTDGEAYDCSVSVNGTKLAYVFSDFLHPAEVHVVDLSDGRDRGVTMANQALVDSVLLSRPEPMRVRDANGFEVQAWFMPAVGPKAAGRRPTLLDIHGGPQYEFGSSFFFEMQYWAGQGYNVVMPNPQGSRGYGRAFDKVLDGNWGAPMFDDITRVTDAVVKRPDVDASRLGVLGGSYGGYAVLWSIAHTDRFRAAIAERPVSDMSTESLDWYLASSNGLGGEYAWGKPWDPKSFNFNDSPLTYVEAVHTPVLMLHSDEDTETPLDQTLIEFSALKQLGREAIFVDVPHENHDLNRVGSPIHRVERLHIFTDWFRRNFKEGD